FFSSRRRHTISKRDWSSDVCSSDLIHIHYQVGESSAHIDIDVCGTFTVLVMNVDGHTVQAKVPTTSYDLSVCFLNVIEVGAQELGLTLDQVLRNTGMVRYSTTIAMNRLIELKWPSLPLL